MGDPACDLWPAWTLLDDVGRVAFRRTLAVDRATWARGRAWVLWKSLIVLAGHNGTDQTQRDVARRDLATVLAEFAADCGGC